MKLNNRKGTEAPEEWAKVGSKVMLEVVEGGIAMQSSMSPREALVALLAAANIAVAAIITQGVQVGVSPEDTRKLVQGIVKEHFPMLEG